ncbi:MAG: tetratricopeptide repeat protein [Acidobacteriota bacterium]|nr:tetratricopeptide repeat protein [Acidobacteriota bacterium]
MTPDPLADLTPSTPVPPEDKQSPAPLPGKLRVVYCLILAAVALVPYLASLRNDFVYDDFDQVLANPYIRNFHHLREIFTSSVWSFLGDFRGASNYYRPVMSMGYLFCYQMFGPHALGFHLANLLANAGVVVLVFLVTLKMFRAPKVALVAACIFALHPIHSEAVNWIAAVTELELALFYLLTFWCFLALARAAGKSSAPLQIAMAGSFVFALLSKEQALTLPVLAAIYEHFFREDRAQTTKFQKLRRYGSLFILAAVYLVFRTHYLGSLAPSLDRPGFGTEDLVVSALALVGQYCWKLVWPAHLCAYYLFPGDITTLYPSALGGLLALAICAYAFVVLRKSDRHAAFGVVWFLATLAPVLNVHWMTSNPFAERYLYLSSVGFCWILGWLGVRWWNSLSARGSRGRVALAIAAGLIAMLCVVRTVARDLDWRDNLTFYTATLELSPDAYYIHNNLGTVYWARGNTAAAADEWRAALRLAPNNEYALHNLGLAEHEQKHYQEAEDLYLRALAVRSNYMDAHLDLGKTYAATGRLQEAEAQMLVAENLSPLSVRAHNTLSEFYFDQRRLPEAEAEARRSVEVEPTPQGYWDLGLVEWLKGDRSGAEKAFLSAEAASPSDSRGHFMLGLLYMDANRNADAMREYRAGLQIEPTNAEAIANLKKLEFLGAQN